MTWNVFLFLFFFFFISAGPLRDCIFPSTRNHERTCQIFEGNDDGIPRVNVFLVYASRKRRDEERRPSGRFRTGSFSRRHAIAPSSSRVHHQNILQIVPPRGHKERFGGHCEIQRDAFQCKYLSPWGHGVIVAISCFSEIQPARLTSPLFYKPFCSSIFSSHSQYLITHPQVLWSALIFHC